MAVDKSKLATMMKVQKAKPSAGQLMLKKQKVGAAPLPDEPTPMKMDAAPAKAKPAMPEDEYERSLALPGMVEEAAQAAEAAADEELEGMIPAAYTEDGGPPPWADPQMWQQALEAVGVGTPDEDRYEEPMAVAAYLYKMMGGPIEGMGAEESPEHEAMESPEHEAAESPAKEAGEKKAASAGAVRGMAGKLLAAKMAAAAPEKAEGELEEAGEAIGESIDEEMPEDINALVEEAADEAMSSMDPEVAMLLEGYDAERDGNPPEWAADTALWEKAVKAVEPKWEDYEAPYAVVTHVYKKMGGGFKRKES